MKAIRSSLLFVMAAIPLAPTHASCSSEDLKQSWTAYVLRIPAKSWECNIDLTDSRQNIGSCYDSTFNEISITSADWRVQPNCSFTINANLADGETFTAKGKLNAAVTRGSGTISIKDRGKIYKGKFNMQFDFLMPTAKDDAVQSPQPGVLGSLIASPNAANTGQLNENDRAIRESSKVGSRGTYRYKIND